MKLEERAGWAITGILWAGTAAFMTYWGIEIATKDVSLYRELLARDSIEYSQFASNYAASGLCFIGAALLGVGSFMHLRPVSAR